MKKYFINNKRKFVLIFTLIIVVLISYKLITVYKINNYINDFSLSFFINNSNVLTSLKNNETNTLSLKNSKNNNNDNKDEEKYQSVLSIEYIKSLNIDSESLKIERQLASGSNYNRYIASYISQNNKIYGLLTIPKQETPQGGFSAIVFNHGYIPPQQYVTTERYLAYVDNLARNGFVVFKIDLRGHGNSEGVATGSYFSNAYTIDAISAVKSLQKYEVVNKDKIGMWGHSMAGNLLLRAMLVEQDIKAGVIWAGAVFSYEDFAKYRISDNSYVRRPQQEPRPDPLDNRENSEEIKKLRENPNEIDFNNEFWSQISLTKNLEYLNSPIQIHHAKNDYVTNIGYSKDLATELENKNKVYEYYEYNGGGHNINSPYFEIAMQRTIDFYKKHLD